jgi:hypothetical protein
MKLEMDGHKPEKRTELALEIYEGYSEVYVEADIQWAHYPMLVLF